MIRSRITLCAVAALLVNSYVITPDDKEKISGKVMAKAVGGLTLSGVAKWGSEKASNNKMVQDFAYTVGINCKDVGNVIAISGGMVSLSFIANDETAKGLEKLSWRAPIAALVAGVVFTRTFQDIAKHVPVIGASITCENKECTGICSECKLTKTTIAIGVYRAVDTVIGVYVPTKDPSNPPAHS